MRARGDQTDLLGALAAGKHVYCEYPLGRDRAESEVLAKAAQAAGVHAAIGLQARELIASGAIGRVLHARILSTSMAFGPQVEAAMAFAGQPENGVIWRPSRARTPSTPPSPCSATSPRPPRWRRLNTATSKWKRVPA
jgi:hypothetical protein